MIKPSAHSNHPWPLLLIIFLVSLFIGVQLGLIGQTLFPQLANQDNSDSSDGEKIKSTPINPFPATKTCLTPPDGGPALNQDFEPCMP